MPEPVPELSTQRLLTMTWLEGTPFLEAAKAPLAERNTIARNMFRAWYVPLYCYGVIHGDPHLGNYTVRPDLGINLLDFGCIRVFDRALRQGRDRPLPRARHGRRGARGRRPTRAGASRSSSREVIDVLNRWARYVYAPLLEDRKRRIQEIATSTTGREIAEHVHRELRRLGGVQPPREFVFMDRAAVGLGSVFMHLKAEVNWHRLFHELIDDFDAERLGERQASALAAAKVPGVAAPRAKRRRGGS